MSKMKKTRRTMGTARSFGYLGVHQNAFQEFKRISNTMLRGIGMTALVRLYKPLTQLQRTLLCPVACLVVF